MTSEVPTSEARIKTNSYVNQDPPIPNQSYSLFSFVPPKEKIEELFGASRYESIQKVLQEKKEELLEKINNTPDDFVAHILTTITPVLVENNKEEAAKTHNSRGAVKFRGAFTTIEEAKKYSEYLRNLDPNYDIFLGQTGFWYPFNPARENVKEQNYFGKELNDLMKSYLKNKTQADIHFEQRMREMNQDKLKDELANEDEDTEIKSEKTETTETTTETNVKQPEVDEDIVQ